MSTCRTDYQWEVVIYDQHELYSKINFWSVEVWENFGEIGSEAPSKAKCLWNEENFDWHNQRLTEDTLETLMAKAANFIKDEQKRIDDLVEKFQGEQK